MQINEIKLGYILYIDLSRLGVKYGNFSVEVVDPISNYLETGCRKKIYASFDPRDEKSYQLRAVKYMGFCAVCI